MIEEALITRLRAYTDVTAIVGQKSYLVEIPQATVLPACVLTTIGAQRELTHDGPLGVTWKYFQISCLADKPSTAKLLAQAVRKAFHGYRGSVAGETIFYAEVQNETDLFDPDYGYQVAVDVTVSFVEN